MTSISADPWLYLSAFGALVGAGLFFFFAYRWTTAAERLEAVEFEELAAGEQPLSEPGPVAAAAAEAAAPQAPPTPPSMVEDLRSLHVALERLARAEDDRFEKLERRLDAIEKRIVETAV